MGLNPLTHAGYVAQDAEWNIGCAKPGGVALTHRLDRLEERTKNAFKDVLDELKLIQTPN